MAKLRIPAPDGKTLVIDVGAADKSEYDDLATAALEDYMSKAATPAAAPARPYSDAEIVKQRKIVAELEKSGGPEIAATQRALLNRMERQDQGASLGQQLATIPGAVVDAAKIVNEDIRKPINREIGAGYAGVADLIAGNGLDKATENIQNVKEGKDVTSGAAVFGEALGDQVTPEQIALQAGFGKVAEMVGPAIGNMLKGWGEKAALNAAGVMKTMADKFGLEKLDDLAQFLMKPVQLGKKELPAIITATSSTDDMLAAAKAVEEAAGAQLGSVSRAADKAIKASIDRGGAAINDEEVAINLLGLKPKVDALKTEAVGAWKTLGKDVAAKFDAMADDLTSFINEQAKGPTETVFSDLSAMRTRLGKLTNFSSETENNLALQQVYGALSDVLKDAAKKVGGTTGADYLKANLVYHQASAVVAALTNKSTKFAVRDLFAPGAMSFIGSIVGGLPGLVVGGLAGAATNAYGHQAVARGLNATAPMIGKGIELGVKAMPVAARAIASALQSPGRKEDEE